MRRLQAMLAAVAVAALVGCGGDGPAGPPDGGAGDGPAQHDAAPVGLSGKLTLNHGPLPAGVTGWVYVYDQGPGSGAPAVDSTEVAADGDWAFPGLPAGTYYLLGAVDVNRSGAYEHPGDALADLFVIPEPQAAPAAGVTLDVLTMMAVVGSVRVAGPGGDESRLATLRATVLDPRNANAMTDATVVVSDGAADYPLAFGAMGYEPATALAAAAVEGTYRFTVSHLLAYQTPLVVEVPHRPLPARPTLLAPTPDQHFGAVADVEVSWQQAAGATDSAVEVFEGGSSVYLAEAVASPHQIPAASAGFAAGRTYRVSVTDRRYAGNSVLVSIEAGATEVTISF